MVGGGILPVICLPVTLGPYYPGIPHLTLPGTPSTAGSLCWSMVHRGTAGRAVPWGSRRLKPVGGRDIPRSGPQRCDSSCARLRRVVPLSQVRNSNDRIDEGTSKAQGRVERSGAQRCCTFLTFRDLYDEHSLHIPDIPDSHRFTLSAQNLRYSGFKSRYRKQFRTRRD